MLLTDWGTTGVYHYGRVPRVLKRWIKAFLTQ